MAPQNVYCGLGGYRRSSSSALGWVGPSRQLSTLPSAFGKVAPSSVEGRWAEGRGEPLAGPLTTLTRHPSSTATAHFSFCRTLLEHTVSTESIPCHLPRTPGTSLTWHDSRSQRAAGGRPVKLLQQPGTETPQVPSHRTRLSPCPPHHLVLSAAPLPYRAGCTLTTVACTTRVPHWVD